MSPGPLIPQRLPSDPKLREFLQEIHRLRSSDAQGIDDNHFRDSIERYQYTVKSLREFFIANGAPILSLDEERDIRQKAFLMAMEESRRLDRKTALGNACCYLIGSFFPVAAGGLGIWSVSGSDQLAIGVSLSFFATLAGFLGAAVVGCRNVIDDAYVGSKDSFSGAA